LDNLKIRIDYNISHISNLFDSVYNKSKLRLSNANKLLQNLSPKTILSKGYSITRKLDGTVIKNFKEVTEGETIESILLEGKLISNIKKIQT